MNADERNQAVCPGHDELLKISITTQTEVRHLNEVLQRFLSQQECQDSKLRDLEINGSKATRDNTESIREISKRVEVLESSEDRRAGESKATVRNAGIVAGVIAIIGTIVSIIATLWRP